MLLCCFRLFKSFVVRLGTLLFKNPSDFLSVMDLGEVVKLEKRAQSSMRALVERQRNHELLPIPTQAMYDYFEAVNGYPDAASITSFGMQWNVRGQSELSLYTPAAHQSKSLKNLDIGLENIARFLRGTLEFDQYAILRINRRQDWMPFIIQYLRADLEFLAEYHGAPVQLADPIMQVAGDGTALRRIGEDGLQRAIATGDFHHYGRDFRVYTPAQLQLRFGLADGKALGAWVGHANILPITRKNMVKLYNQRDVDAYAAEMCVPEVTEPDPVAPLKKDMPWKQYKQMLRVEKPVKIIRS